MGSDRSGISRRHFIQGAGVVAATAGVAQLAGGCSSSSSSSSPSSAPLSSFAPRGKLRRQPNILLIISDEYRYPPVYESEALKDFRARYLTAEESLRDNGLEFRNHYIMTSACVPSRASIFTGHYPSLHGVTQTTGAAKESIEDDQFWLAPYTLPAAGNYFRAAGYDCYYKGKWHVSDADMYTPGTYDPLLSFDSHGNPDPAKEADYLDADRLGPYGFSGWIGPEPHGSNPLNSGSSAAAGPGRDVKFASQVVDLLGELGKRGDGRPWFVVGSFTNPHDITTFGNLTLKNPSWNLMGQLKGTKVPREMFDPAMYEATSGESLDTKPTCQPSYVQTYPKMLQPTDNTTEFRQFYYQMQQNVNGDIKKVLDALAADPDMAADTIVIFTADHGDMLGAHGGMFQKWHQAYEETTHVPFIVHNPTLFEGRQTLDGLTSHADLLPTLLGLAGIDVGKAQEELGKDYDEVHPFVGRDLSDVIVGTAEPNTVTGPVYFMTDDEISSGAHQVMPNGQMYRSVVQPNHVETVVALLPTGAGGAVEKWKYSRYFDNPQFWSDPDGDPPEDVFTFIEGDLQAPGTKTAVTTVKRDPLPDQIEAYNVTADPLELTNLATSSDPRVRSTLGKLEGMLEEQCKAKRLKPSSGVVPSQPDC